jgi:hypothetical protein
MIGGFALNTLKKLYGDRFGFPSASIVLAKAMGLGPIEPSNKPCSFGVSKADGRKLFI